ncbi:MAG: DUF1540 domain-containing protein [Clostridia bacterium]|nr:DUF1540 domain-containing protein [Clostridia bacterium]
MNKDDKSKKPIKGVICDAVNCEYNNGDGECRAKQISVGPIYANSCTDTVCATFRKREASNGATV